MAGTTAYGKAVELQYAETKKRLGDRATFLAITKRQGDFIRLQNVGNISRGLDRNGRRMAPYKMATIAQRKKLGLQTGYVDLKRTGRFYESILVRNARVQVSGTQVTAQIEIGVSATMAGRLKGFTTGKYGRRGRNRPRDVVGVADPGTPLYSRQQREIERIAREELGKLARGSVTITQRGIT